MADKLQAFIINNVRIIESTLEDFGIIIEGYDKEQLKVIIRDRVSWILELTGEIKNALEQETTIKK